MLFKNKPARDASSDNILSLKEQKRAGQEFASWIDYAGLINKDEWLIAGWAYHPTLTDLKATFSTGRPGETCELTLIRGKRPDVCIHHGDTDLDKQPGFVIIARLEGKEAFNDKMHATLVLEIGGEKLEHKLERPGPVDLEKLALSLSAFSKRQRTSAFLHIFNQADCLFINQLANAPRPENGGIHIDDAIALSGGFFVNGWVDNSRGELVGIYLLSDTRLSDNIIDDLSSYHRRDVNDAFGHIPDTYEAGGFAYVPLEHAEDSNHFMVVAITNRGEVASKSFMAIQPNDNEIELTQLVLGNIDIRSADLGGIFARHVDTVLQELWQERLSADNEADVFEYGSRPEDPKRSVIVPVYGRYDLVMYQLAQFASDPDFRETDLLYVLDDPRIRKDFLPLCEDCSRIFGVPFRVVTNNRNQGFACANNLGAKHASSDLLVLMNSDVLPQQKGWLGRLQAQYGTLENPGAVGVRLVYDDGTIQHDGMAFIQSPEFPALWLNDHPNKGLPVLLAEAPGVRALPAVTAALMMIGLDRYEEAGGLDPAYILGDFEDSDFCLKLREAGYQNYLVSTEQLFHLERQSQNLVDAGDWKHKLTLYNAWQHTRRWGETIKAINGSLS